MLACLLSSLLTLRGVTKQSFGSLLNLELIVEVLTRCCLFVLPTDLNEDGDDRSLIHMSHCMVPVQVAKKLNFSATTIEIKSNVKNFIFIFKKKFHVDFSSSQISV